MATYAELHQLANNGDLKDKVGVALTIAAQAKLAGTPTSSDSKWARSTLTSLERESEKVLRLILAANVGQTQANILGASDAAIQTEVDAVVDGYIAGEP